MTYHLIYATTYLVNTEGTQIRTSRTLAAIEASLGTQADDGMPLHNFLAIYENRPAHFPRADAVRQQLDRQARNWSPCEWPPRCRITTGRCCLKRRPRARCWRKCWVLR